MQKRPLTPGMKSDDMCRRIKQAHECGHEPIVRTGAAFDFQVIATEGCVDLWSPKVIRAGAGGHFRSTLIESVAPDLGPLRAAGLHPFVVTADGRTAAVEAVKRSEPLALVVGNEAHGVPEELRTRPDLETTKIPMPGGVESLNVAVAAAILMYLRMAAS